MITIRTKADGTATYHLDPYPHWDGDDAMAERGEALRVLSDAELVEHGLTTKMNDRSQRLHRALEIACLESGIEVVQFVLPQLDPPDDHMSSLIGEYAKGLTARRK